MEQSQNTHERVNLHQFHLQTLMECLRAHNLNLKLKFIINA